jgi:hypothetical protein
MSYEYVNGQTALVKLSIFHEYSGQQSSQNTGFLKLNAWSPKLI